MHTSTTKNDWVTVSKGIAIISVVAGHIFVGWISEAIFLFHMPFFFFLSGVLFNSRSQKTLAISKAKAQLIPYFKYLMFFFLIVILNKFLNNEISPMIFIKELAKQVLGGRWLTQVESVFWFIPVFYLSQQLLNFIINNISKKNAQAIFIIMLILAYANSYLLNINSPLNILSVLYVTPIMYCGFLLKDKIWKINSKLLISISILGIILVETFPQVFSIDIKYAAYGFPIFSFIVSIAISILLMQASRAKILNNNILIFAGSSSMSIMFIHQFFRFDIYSKLSHNNLVIFMLTIITSFAYAYLLKIYARKRKII